MAGDDDGLVTARRASGFPFGIAREQPLISAGDQWWQPIAGYEAMNTIRKGQIRWLPKMDVVGQVRFIDRTFGIAA